MGILFLVCAMIFTIEYYYQFVIPCVKAVTVHKISARFVKTKSIIVLMSQRFQFIMMYII